VDEAERRREQVDAAMNVGSARIPSWATDVKSPLHATMAFVYAFAFVAALDIITPLPGFVAIALAFWHLRRRHRGARLALVAALAGTAIGVVQYAAFLR
jgi:hypothetical protein